MINQWECMILRVTFKTTMLKFSLCDYSDAHLLVKGRIIITAAENDAVLRQACKRKKL